MLKFALTLSAFLFCAFTPLSAYAVNISSCGESSGYSYFADRGLAEKKDVGWNKNSKIPDGKFSLVRDEEGNFDLLVVDATGDITSSVSLGAKVVPAIATNESLTVLVLYPMLVETYVFQKLKNGNYQAMWTQAKAETPLPLVSAFIADCSYLNLGALNN